MGIDKPKPKKNEMSQHKILVLIKNRFQSMKTQASLCKCAARQNFCCSHTRGMDEDQSFDRQPRLIHQNGCLLEALRHRGS